MLVITTLCSFGALLMCIFTMYDARRSRTATEDLMKERLSQELSDQREEALRRNSENRRELTDTLRATSANISEAVRAIGDMQSERIERLERHSESLNATLNQQLDTLNRQSQEMRSENVRQLASLNSQFQDLCNKNAAQLSALRSEVMERLQSSIEKRFTTSFSLVSQQLDALQQGLGEMRGLATSVGDLKRILTNVKTRGTWGEFQLQAILEQILAPEQYSANVAIRPNTRERVEFAIRLPGDGDAAHPVWLPIDSKFPTEDYQRICSAAEQNDAVRLAEAQNALAKTLEREAKDVNEKYIHPPMSTDFAVIFLPTEALYAEVMRNTTLIDRLQQKYRVMLSGPSTLAALLSSLRMGFRALAIQQRSTEVWETLSAVRAEFIRFGESLDKVHRHLSTVTNAIEETSRRSRVLQKRLDAADRLAQTELADAQQLNISTAERTGTSDIGLY